MENLECNHEEISEDQGQLDSPQLEAWKNQERLKAEIKSCGLKRKILGEPILLWDSSESGKIIKRKVEPLVRDVADVKDDNNAMPLDEKNREILMRPEIPEVIVKRAEIK